MDPADIGMGKRESVSDTAKVISSTGDLIMARTFEYKTIEVLAENSIVPVVNGLSDLEHPCQILADYMTVWEVKGKLEGLTIGYVGDGENNIAHSLCLGATILGMNFQCGAPKGYWMKKTIDPEEAVKNADVVITDTWVSIGDEQEKKQRMKTFKPYQVNQKLMQAANAENRLHVQKALLFLLQTHEN